MMPAGSPRVSATPKHFACALAPFPRSTWIHPHVPHDNFDRVCKNIWRRASEAEEALDRGQRSPERQRNTDRRAPDDKPSHRAEEQREEADDLGLSTRYEEDKRQYHAAFTLPCPYLSGHVAKPAQELTPVMEEEMKRNEEAKEKTILVEDAGDNQSSVANSVKTIWLPHPSSRVDKRSSASENQPPATNPVCSTAENHTLRLGDEEDPQLAPCKSEDVKNTSSSSDSNSSYDDNDSLTLPGVRSRGTDDSEGDSESENSDCDEEGNTTLHSFDELSYDREQDSPSSWTETDLPALPTIQAGILPPPTGPPASGKMHCQWEMPLSFCPRDIPAATLANGVTAHAEAPVQRLLWKAKAPQANSGNNAPAAAAAAAAPAQQEAYDLLADFPALQASKKPLALGVFRDRNPKTKGAEWKGGHTRSQNQCQESRASHQRRMENVPHKVSSICAGDHKYVLDLQRFGQGISATISCEEQKAENQLPPRATDGVDANGRSWASAAMTGMKQAAAPQEKARPYTLQQIVTINQAKARYSAAPNFQNKVIPCYQAAAPMWQGPRPRNQNPLVRPGYPPTHQHFGVQANPVNCHQGVGFPRFPLQQARGQRAKHM